MTDHISLTEAQRLCREEPEIAADILFSLWEFVKRKPDDELLMGSYAMGTDPDVMASA